MSNPNANQHSTKTLLIAGGIALLVFILYLATTGHLTIITS